MRKEERKEMTCAEAIGIVNDYENGKNISYAKYSEAMDVLWK